MNSLEGQFLVAMPDMSDERFAESVIYLIGHNDDGAMGLVVNRNHDGLSFGDILDEIELKPGADLPDVTPQVRDRQVLRGGPVEQRRGFVLHSPDFISESTYPVGNDVCLTATLDVLRAMASGSGPAQSLFALGCCGWSPGQLEAEIQANGWLTVPFSTDLLFETPIEQRYDGALAQLHITRASLSSESGHA